MVSKLKKWFFSILSMLMLGILLIIIEQIITDWWESEPPLADKIKTPSPVEVLNKHENNQYNNNQTDVVPLPLQTIEKPAVTDDIVVQLKRLHNPDAPVTVNLWFDERGKTYFSSRNKVTIKYKISGTGTPAYLTLLNVSPVGKLSLLFSEAVEVGKVYGSSQSGQYATTVKQIYLDAGQEYFKAIVTSEPINWKAFIAAAVQGKSRLAFWGTAELTVVVD